MRKAFLLGLLSLAALGLVSVQADAAHYYPYGWYQPKGPCWLRWNGFREVWVPPSPTQWTTVRPLPGCSLDGGLPAGGPQVLFTPIGSVPPPAYYGETWTPGKHLGERPSVRQLIPEPHPWVPHGPYLP